MFTLRLAAIFIMAIVPLADADFAMADANVHPGTLLHQVAVFSDDPQAIHDPRHAQPQTGTDKMFAPIGLIRTNHRVPDISDSTTTLNFHIGTAFLVSPCYLLTAYHVVFGTRKSKPEPDRDYSVTFSVHAKKSRAVPAKYGEVYRFGGRDWVLLLLDSDTQQRCLGEDTNIGWIELAPLPPAQAMKKSLSIAGYPYDKGSSSLWRQDTCHLYEKQGDIENDGLWTTDCATRPRASGSPIFFVQEGVLNVVALMSGHQGVVIGNEVLPRWDPDRANLALDISKIISSEPDFLKLIERDIARFGEPNPARVVQPSAAASAQP
jgi:V8-like Glu-specific endopeptidase